MLEVRHLCKDYGAFKLQDISFNLPKGYIMGFLGRNGAGKSTTINSLLNIVRRDSGEIKLFGVDLDGHESEIKQRTGFMLGEFNYYPRVKLKTITDVYGRFFDRWDIDAYRGYMNRFGIDENKRVNQLSAGMKVKYSIALAISHQSDLFIFDEPTSGLDPIARDELLDIFRDLISDGEKSILFSTHITSDLDKCADYILLLKDGRLILNSTKDELIDSHAFITGNASRLTEDLRRRMVSYKEHSYGFVGLIERKNLRPEDDFELQKPNIEDIMVYYDREGENESVNL